MKEPESGEFQIPPVERRSVDGGFEERFADGGNEGRTDGLTHVAWCLIVFLLFLAVVGAILGVMYVCGE